VAGLVVKPTTDGTRYKLSLLQGLALDIDGILYEGKKALPGAVDLIDHLNKTATPYVLLSNNSAKRLEDHYEILRSLGMETPIGQIITASRITAEVLSREAPLGARCLVIGEAGLVEELERMGFEVTQSDYREVTLVVLGMDRNFTYEKLLTGARAILRGAQFISSNPDPVYSDGEEILPASGAIQAAIEISTGVKARVTGKPEIYGYYMALEVLALPAERVGMVGDQILTDHLGAQRAGMKRLLVLSSLTTSYSPEESGDLVDSVYADTQDFTREWINRNIITR
jgi:HAD superfamily hydrolase (TIGR01450 family)